MKLKFEDIPNSILSYPNQYEKEWGIQTKRVECLVKKETWAIFVGHKTDGTKTMFYARKAQRADEDGWNWYCPSEDEVEQGFIYASEMCQILNRENERIRQKGSRN